jgi:hypothetical protein
MQLESRPRWGILSTRAHLDPGKLVSDVLLYDRLVFPEPAPEDVERWRAEGWEPEKLTAILKHLGPLAHAARWTKDLRVEWKARFDALSTVASETDAIAYGMTPMVIAFTAWKDIQKKTDGVPIPVAAFQSEEEAKAALAYRTGPTDDPIHHGVALLFKRCLNVSAESAGALEGQAALEKAVELSATTDFQAARRTMYDWQDAISQQHWPVEKAIALLQEQMIDYDGRIQGRFGKLAKHAAARIVSVGGGVALGAAIAGPAGSIVGGVVADGIREYVADLAKGLAKKGIEAAVECGVARFPGFKSTKSDGNPGAALSMAISAVYKR